MMCSVCGSSGCRPSRAGCCRPGGRCAAPAVIGANASCKGVPMMRRECVLLRSLVLLLVGACATAGHDVAEKGREIVLGMNAETFEACAGIPTRTKQIDPRTEILSYEIKNEN